LNVSTPFTLNTSAAEATAAAGQTWTAYRALGRSQWLAPAEVERLQLAKARLLLRHCLRNVAYYRERLTAAGFVPEDLSTMEDFRRLPLLPRATFQERFADFCAAVLPSATLFTGDCKTSGTSGVAVQVFQTNVTDLWWWALYLRDLEWSGIDPRGTLAAIRPTRFPMAGEELKRYQEGISQPYWALPLLPLIQTGPAHGMDIHQDPRRQLAWLRRVAPNCLVSYPSNLDFLAGLIEEEGQRLPSLKVIQIVSETLTDEVRARVEATFGVPVKDMYSCGEAGYLASPCPQGRGLHVHAESVILEVLDADGRPCPPGQTGRVVVTALHNYLNPLIRYEIMDEALVGETPCPCGRGLPLLTKVLGKVRPLFRLPDGRMKHSDGLTQELRLLGGMNQHQVVQRAVDQFLVRVAPGRAWTPEHPERIRRLVREHLEAPVRVEVEVHERLPLPPGGKLLDVISELAPVPPFPAVAQVRGEAVEPPKPAPPSASAAQTWTIHQELGRSQWLAPAEVERLQLAKARLLLKHCLRNVPYYRERLTAAGAVPEDLSTMEDFRRLPLLPRRTFQERFADFHADALPPDTVRAGEYATSGTSGVPVRVSTTNVTNQWWMALHLRDLEWTGVDPRGSLASVRFIGASVGEEELKRYREGVTLPGWFPGPRPLIETGPLHVMDIHQDPRLQLAWLRRVAPDYLLSYASNLDFLAGLVREGGERLPSLKAVQNISETLTDEIRARVEAAFGVPVKNAYSCGEAGYLASPCPQGRGLHAHAESVILEVLDEHDRPCVPGQSGRVVLTALHNYLTPLVRYEIMDEAVMGDSPCPCGRGLPLLAEVRGKVRSLFRLPDGRVKHAGGLAKGLPHLGGMIQHQIVQRAVDHFLVRVVPNRAWTPDHPERVRRLVREHVEAPVRVDVETYERLPLSPGGKLLDVVSELAPASPAPAAAQDRGEEAPESPKPSPTPSVAQRATGRHGGNRTVLFGWELGAGLGHVRRLLPLAKALAAHGCRPVFAVRDAAEGVAELRGASFPVLQAPTRPTTADPSFLAVSYADVLAVRGFAAVEELAPIVQAWQALIDEVRPALVVCDHSPTLCLSAYGAVHTVAVGNGFTLPPADLPTFPLMLPGRAPLVPEAELLAVVREVQARRGRPAPETLPGLFGRADRFLTVLPGLDPYAGLRQELPLGPLGPLAPPTPPPARPAFFAYLSAETRNLDNLENLLAGLARSGYPGIVYLRGASPEMRGRLRKPGLDILEAPLPPADAMAGASVVVHHAGVGMAQHALAAGRPQLVFPGHLEQVLNAQLLHRLGVGQYVLGPVAEEVAAGELQRLIRDRAAARRAAARAAALRKGDPWDSLPRITEHCLVLLEQSVSSPSPN